MRAAALAAVLMTFATACVAGNCNKLVGKAFFAGGGTPPLDFAQKRPGEISLGQHIVPGQRFRVTAITPGDNSDDDLTVQTQDGRTLSIFCEQVLSALEPWSPGQKLIESSAADYAHAKAEVQQRQSLVRRKEAARVAKLKARGGVRIGMTEKQVLASEWGAPEKRNHTVTAAGDDEQWVYPNFNFLYFENGVLTAIQTNTP